MNDQLLLAALAYAERGWPVFPLHNPQNNGCTCERAGCTAIGKHPRTRNGLSDATTDVGRIRTWWAQWPDANIGVLTGEESGLLVVDVDNKGAKCGRDNLASFAAEFGGLPTTLTATTGGGEHLFFHHPGVTVKNSVSKIADGVDVRAERGYIVAAPSLHANGTRYAWKNPEQSLMEVPSWLLTKSAMRKEKAEKMQNEERNALLDAPIIYEGERNDTLYKLGCALRGKQGMERKTIAGILLQYNIEKCDPALNTAEVLAIVESVCQHPAEIGAKKSAKRMEQNPLYWYQFNTRDWFSDQNLMLMNDAQTGWYIRLKALAWDSGGFLPADLDKLWVLAKAKSRKVFERDCGLVLAEYEDVEVDGERKLKHPKLAALYAHTLQEWMKKKEAGEASKAARMAAFQSSQNFAVVAATESPAV